MAKEKSLSLEHCQRIDRALDSIQEAQQIIERAAQALCPVPFFSDLWTQTNQLRATVNKHWHRIAQKRAEFTCDVRPTGTEAATP